MKIQRFEYSLIIFVKICIRNLIICHAKNFRFQIEKQTQFFFVVFLIINEIVAINEIDIVIIILLSFLSFWFCRRWNENFRWFDNFRWNNNWLRCDDDIDCDNDRRWNNNVCQRVRRLTTFFNNRDFLLFD